MKHKLKIYSLSSVSGMGCSDLKSNENPCTEWKFYKHWTALPVSVANPFAPAVPMQLLVWLPLQL